MIAMITAFREFIVDACIGLLTSKFSNDFERVDEGLYWLLSARGDEHADHLGIGGAANIHEVAQ